MALLEDVSELVGDESLSPGGLGLVMTLGKVDVVAGSKSAGVDLARRLPGRVIVVDTNSIKIFVEVRLHRAAQPGSQRRADAAGKRFMKIRRNVGPVARCFSLQLFLRAFIAGPAAGARGGDAVFGRAVHVRGALNGQVSGGAQEILRKRVLRGTVLAGRPRFH